MIDCDLIVVFSGVAAMPGIAAVWEYLGVSPFYRLSGLRSITVSGRLDVGTARNCQPERGGGGRQVRVW